MTFDDIDNNKIIDIPAAFWSTEARLSCFHQSVSASSYVRMFAVLYVTISTVGIGTATLES